MLPVIPNWFHYGVMLTVVVYTFRRGEIEERLTGAYFLAGTISGHLAQMLTNNSIFWDVVFQSIDVMFFTAMMLRSKKYWTVLACGISFLELATASLRPVYPTTIWAYATLTLVWFYSLLLTISLGTWRLRRRDEAGATSP
jgi:hypothetical protein